MRARLPAVDPDLPRGSLRDLAPPGSPAAPGRGGRTASRRRGEKNASSRRWRARRRCRALCAVCHSLRRLLPDGRFQNRRDVRDGRRRERARREVHRGGVVRGQGRGNRGVVGPRRGNPVIDWFDDWVSLVGRRAVREDGRRRDGVGGGEDRVRERDGSVLVCFAGCLLSGYALVDEPHRLALLWRKG